VAEPKVDRPHIPGYGIPTSVDGVLPWSWALERLGRAEIYWLATADADGAPHLIPIWGAWVGGHWYVEGGPTRWQRNLRANPRMAIHVELRGGSGVSGAEVVIVEGTAVELVAPKDPLASRILEGYAKYQPGYVASASHWSQGGLWRLDATKAFAWTTFPDDMTRFTFEA
jgi:nitroimidazol reductase NimA-like FMN-containing flavoprotein (pyridoxamine 5'-phosphate oxidase superfamily)